ncbi:UDP-N-acetylmuramoyl-L-alanyl-D-glutamate--2,6-diaminopimelate ligase [Lachnospira pectinoschiza]|uniref:UDP-N-acetylmuramoyl-L-alanyl-D-glutamate--2,6-diaminopimelate ligase n=1 Tax=Lachnospira pectinoschiza TaxID=28052 RepID=A0A1G9Z3F4_9FIRM|nr:UDP-N-acetylmuramoyl-L-alanyl-D-glutamate--2,6-diaminopimelate ligase [Lachnospira pectinoschiza]SDN15216.1 UDP-N-acetylmuramoylalanyl-D-glutamate--2,6-diaminopimelate ligase [Lachnospira pectinoschiza]
MLLSEILKNCIENECTDFSYEILQGKEDIYVTNVSSDSRKVDKDGVFVAIKGAVVDGHKFIPNVIDRASAIVVESTANLADIPEGITVIKTDNTRLALALMSASIYKNPDKEIFTIGITGTKGKTTTTYMIKNVLEACGIKTGLIGTIETIIGDEHIPSENTTPESSQIHESFRKMVNAGCKAVVMEVSSQGLKLDRTAGIMFNIGVFTNLEPDHIGPNEHESFEDYLECKSKLFRQCSTGIFNADDEHVEKMIKNATCKIETYAIDKDADLKASDIKLFHEGGNIGLNYKLVSKDDSKDLEVKLNLPGRFSVYNSLSAIAVTKHFDVPEATLLKTLQEVKVKGRIELVKVSDNFSLMIDYAHNAMSLESLLTTLREYNPHRIVTLFGCGGNRSRDRRFEMGEVSGKLSDLTIITSDNPRDEEPEAIIKDIITGISKTDGKHVDIIDRKEAIKYAIAHGEPGDIIVLAGKGHEDYQIIKGVKHHMDERELIAEVLEELKR